MKHRPLNRSVGAKTGHLTKVNRLLFNVLAVLSLVLCLGAAGLWVRSYIGGGSSWRWPSARVIPPRRFDITAAAGDVEMNLRLGRLAKPVVSYWQTTVFTLIYGTMSGRGFVHVLMPLWLPTTFFLLFPLVRAARWHRSHPVDEGVCLNCGYDLRATPHGERCPECGTASPAGAPNA
jgi:hypothetical protein